MKVIATIIGLLLTSQIANGAPLICGDTDLDATPYFTFILEFEGGLYNPTALDISVVPSAFSGSEEVVTEYPVIGCQDLQLTETNFGVIFECDADGDAGYGSIDLFAEGTSVLGSITFPEGTDLGPHRVWEDSEFQFSCGMTM